MRVSAADYDEAMHYALHARRMLEYHSEYARTDIEMGERLRRLLGRRDAMMAENLAYIKRRETGCVLAFAHNSHLKCGEAEWQLGEHALKWKPTGWHKRETLGDRYAVIGVGVGASVVMNLGVPEGGTLEALLTSVGAPAAIVPTHRGDGLPTAAIESLATRANEKNPGYFPFTGQSVREFDALAVIGGG